jgi:shikimate kinase
VTLPVLPIVLIGPMAAGKSTLGKYLAEALNLEQYPMDWVRWYYYLKNGYSLKAEKNLTRFQDKLAYWKPFEVDAVGRVVQDFKGIIDFGAGHGHFTDLEQRAQVKKALQGLPVILVLPHEDLERSIVTCNTRYAERNGGRALTSDERESNREFVYSDSFRALATCSFFTGDESPEQSAQRLIKIMGWA